VTPRDDDRGGGLLGFFSIVGWTATVLGLAANGFLSPTHAAFALVGLVAVVAVARALRISLAKFVWGVGLPSVSIVTFVIRNGMGNPEETRALGVAVLALIVALLGLYLIARAFFRR